MTALGFGLLLLLGVAVLAVVFRPPWPVRSFALAAVVLVFAGLRHQLGDIVQRRFFMRVDFEDVDVRRIRRVRADRSGHGSEHYVETIVRLHSDATV